jgi:hypothetical protein
MSDSASSGWHLAGMLPFAPPDTLDDHDVLDTGRGRYWECGLSDWHLLAGWLAGPETLMRFPDHREHWITEHCITETGDVEVSRRLETAEERQERDDWTNEHLRDLGLPERPNGYRWFQRVPDGLTGRDVLAAAGRAQAELPDGLAMRLTVPFIRAAVQQVYGLPVTPPPPLPAEAWTPQEVNPRVGADVRADRQRTAQLLSAPLSGPAHRSDIVDPPLSAVPILRCARLERSLRFYALLGFDAEELAGYAVLRCGDVTLHLRRTTDVVPGGCHFHVADAARLWRQLRDQGVPMLGRLDETNEHLSTFVLLDPDNNCLRFASPRS